LPLSCRWWQYVSKLIFYLELSICLSYKLVCWGSLISLYYLQSTMLVAFLNWTELLYSSTLHCVFRYCTVWQHVQSREQEEDYVYDWRSSVDRVWWTAQRLSIVLENLPNILQHTFCLLHSVVLHMFVHH
jgi:hypothetical protein